MNLSEERINHLSHLVLNLLKAKGVAKVTDETKALIGVKKAIWEFGELLESLATQVRQKITSLKRNVPEGSREWDVLYRQYLGEALNKRGL